jgi:hypothetical protein
MNNSQKSKKQFFYVIKTRFKLMMAFFSIYNGNKMMKYLDVNNLHLYKKKEIDN